MAKKTNGDSMASLLVIFMGYLRSINNNTSVYIGLEIHVGYYYYRKEEDNNERFIIHHIINDVSNNIKSVNVLRETFCLYLSYFALLKLRRASQESI